MNLGFRRQLAMESSISMQRRITDIFGDLAKTEDNADQCRTRHRLNAAFEDLANCKKSAQADSLYSLADYGEYRKVSFLGDHETIFAARAEISTEGPRRPPQRVCAAEVEGKSEDVRDYTSTKAIKDGEVVYVDSSMQQDNYCNALEDYRRVTALLVVIYYARVSTDYAFGDRVRFNGSDPGAFVAVMLACSSRFWGTHHFDRFSEPAIGTLLHSVLTEWNNVSFTLQKKPCILRLQ